MAIEIVLHVCIIGSSRRKRRNEIFNESDCYFVRFQYLPEITLVLLNSPSVDVCKRVLTTSKGTATPWDSDAQRPPAIKYLRNRLRESLYGYGIWRERGRESVSDRVIIK